MRMLRRYWVAIGIAAVLTACAGRGASTSPGVDRNLLVQDQFADRGFHTAYDVVEAMRSNWLSSRGPNSFQSPTQVQVYFDGVRMGGIETLRTIDVRPVTYMRYFDGIAATARWGLDHGAGAIYVSTHPMSEMIGASSGKAPPRSHTL